MCCDSITTMAKFDRESFNLLKMTDSGSESLPDLTFDLPNDNRQKKKVRLKRKERKPRNGSNNRQITKLHETWWSLPTLPASSCFITVAGTFATIAVISIGLFTSNLHYKIQALEGQLKKKIVDDDAKSVPETLEIIRNRLSVLESNQTGLAKQLEKINTAILGLEDKIEKINKSMSVDVTNPTELRQNVAELELGIGEVTKQLNVVVNRSLDNSGSIVMLNKELNTLKLNEIDMKNGESSVVTNSTNNVAHFRSQIEALNSKLAVNSRRLDKLNSTALNIEHNSTVRNNLEHEDIVAINGLVSQLQDDNLNVSSSLQSLNKSCSEQLHTLRVDMNILQEKVVKMETSQNKMEAIQNIMEASQNKMEASQSKMEASQHKIEASQKIIEFAGETKDSKVLQKENLHSQPEPSRLMTHSNASTNPL